MARPLRIDYAGAVHHVTSRGDRRENIFLDDEDRLLWMEVFAQVCSRYHWRCHAWCLMDNHYHILIETLEGNLSAGMRQLNGVFTQRSNRRHGLAGHVFQGRYKAILVEKEAHLLELARYVVLNPVRAGMVDHPRQWPWSSYPAMAGLTGAPAWLETDWILGCFGRQRRRAVARYAEFVEEGMGSPSPWSHLRHQVFLGSEDFVLKVRGRLSERDGEELAEVPRRQRRAMVKPLAWYRRHETDARKAMALAYRSGGYTMKEIADAFGVHYSTVSRAVRRFEDA